MGVDADKAQAREKVAGSMQAFYRIPFAGFEKYTPYGTPDEVAEFIAPYVEAGCEHFNFVMADNPETILERSLAVRDELAKICR